MTRSSGSGAAVVVGTEAGEPDDASGVALGVAGAVAVGPPVIKGLAGDGAAAQPAIKAAMMPTAQKVTPL
jgi:hypothetical protein